MWGSLRLAPISCDVIRNVQSVSRNSRMAGQLPVDLKLLLEAYDVGQQYHKLSKQGVTTIDQFAALSAKRLHDLGINDFNVRFRALPKAQTLVNSVWQRDAIKQDLLVSSRLSYRNQRHESLV